MARRPHLSLHRLEGSLERRKRKGYPSSPDRDHTTHGARLQAALVEIVTRKAARNDPADDPSIILKITTDGYLSEESLAGVGLQVLSQQDDTVTVVLSMDPQLSQVRIRSSQYAGPVPAGNKAPSHAGFFDAVEDFLELEPADRIGSALRRDGYTSVPEIPDNVAFLLDVELWDVDDAVLRELYVERVRLAAEASGGEFLSRYRGAGLFIARVRGPGTCLKVLLAMKEIAWIDRPARPDFAPDPVANVTIADLPALDPPLAGSVCIGIVDSGITASHPMLQGVIAGAFGVPEHFGNDDEKRHGTSVAALAAYGSLTEHFAQGRLAPQFRIASAKVVDAHGRFDEDRAVADIIEEAIRRLHGEYGCRIINVSLADIDHLVGGRPSNWAMALDNLVRELGIIVTISAGNVSGISARLHTEGLSIYPGYLLEEDNRLLEPASAVNALVVGSLAHGNGLMAGDEENADVIALTDIHHPSPFSRAGPGFGNSIKPDLVEYGGTAVWMGYASTLSADRVGCGVLTLNGNYLQSLMTYRHGTSFAAPVAAFKAALLLSEFPGHSANFIRALMGLSTDHPPALIDRVGAPDGKESFLHAGYGVVDIGLASASEDHRVVMAIEDSLPVDRFAVYEIPIPTDFQRIKGRRHIKVSLAFDPPVRNTRKEYMGIKMGYHLVRGKTADDVFDRFRKWDKAEKDANGGELVFEGNSWRCKMTPVNTLQEAGTLQVGSFVAHKDISGYGNSYYLVVRCEGKWASSLVEEQTFAVAVELWHEANLALYQQVAVSLGV